jgi:hypothetical protein
MMPVWGVQTQETVSMFRQNSHRSCEEDNKSENIAESKMTGQNGQIHRTAKAKSHDSPQ